VSVRTHDNEIDMSFLGHFRNPLEWYSTGQESLTSQAGIPNAFGVRLKSTMEITLLSRKQRKQPCP
jgi:hypothetical protein